MAGDKLFEIEEALRAQLCPMFHKARQTNRLESSFEPRWPGGRSTSCSGSPRGPS